MATSEIQPANDLTSHPAAYRFDEFVFDPASGEVRSLDEEEAVVLRPQVAELLAHLCARSGEVVSREELCRALWHDRHVDADQGLNQCIRQLRLALGDDAASPRLVETLPRRGYRLLPSVTVGETKVETVHEEAKAGSSGVSGRLFAHPRAVVFLGAGLLGLLALWLATFPLERTGETLEPALAPMAPEAPEVERIRPEAADRVDAPEGPAREPFLAGRFHLRQRGESGATRKAFERFREAALLAPEHASSWTGLAEAAVGLDNPDADERREARAAADRAVDLAPDSADAHLQRGRVALWLDHRWADAADSFEAALALDPETPWAREELAFVSMLTGQNERAAAEIERALRVDSVQATALGDAAGIWLALGRWNDALTAADRLESIDIDATWTKIVRVVAHEGRGDFESARAAALEHLDLLDLPSADLASLDPVEALERYRRRKLEYFATLGPKSSLARALVHGALAENVEALAEFEVALEQYPVIALFHLRDPRFAGLCRELGFRRILDGLSLADRCS